MDPFHSAHWYTGEHNIASLPIGTIIMVIDRDCYWSQHKAPMFTEFTKSLHNRAPSVKAYMIDFAKWEFPHIEGFPTLMVKTKNKGLVKLGPSQNFKSDLANALKLALQNKE